MKWAVLAPFINLDNVATSNWLESFLKSDHHVLERIPRDKPLQKWHDRKSKFTTISEWIRYWKHATKALRSNPDGIISVFPQLAACAGLQQSFSRKKRPIVAWLFNVGTCSEGIKGYFARFSLKHVDRFVVHTRDEIEIYSDWLGFSKDRFIFAPYQAPKIERKHAEDTKNPFIASLGSAHRDYERLCNSVRKLGIRTKIASGKSALDGVDIPECVETPFGISREECFEIAQKARLSVIPLKPKKNITAAGQITIVEAMQMGCTIIATRIYGVDDYIEHGKTGWLIDPDSTEQLTEAIELLWNDEELRCQLGKNAKKHANLHFSDEAAGANLKNILDGFL
jgi:glycosyltransferase involved in cell wall biosynthesis